MRKLQAILTALSALLVTFTVISGFWIRYFGNAAADAGSASFHMVLAVATGVTVLATTVVTLIRK